MATLQLAKGLALIYYTGVDYLASNVSPKQELVDDTVYVVTEAVAKKLVHTRRATRVDVDALKGFDIKTPDSKFNTDVGILSLNIQCNDEQDTEMHNLKKDLTEEDELDLNPVEAVTPQIPRAPVQRVSKPQIVKPQIVKPQIVKPEIVKPEIVKPEIEQGL